MRREEINQLLELAKKAGFTDFEVYTETSKRFSTSIFKGEVDKFSYSEPAGVSVRGIFNGKMGNAYTERVDLEALEALVYDCLSNAQISEVEEIAEIYTPPATYPCVETEDGDLHEMTAAEKIQQLKDAETLGMQLDSRVDQITNGYGDLVSTVGIYNTKGLALEYTLSLGYAYFAPILKQGQETKNEMVLKLFKTRDAFKANELVEEAVNNTAHMFGAEAIPSGNYKAVIGNKAVSCLLSAMSSIFSAEAADKGLTLFKDKVGEVVASSMVNIVEDPHLASGFASIPFDSEGVPTQKKRLIDGGRLTGFIHNLKTARKFGVEPTGNGFKASFKTPVGIATTNLFVESGSESFETMLSRVQNGVYLTAFDGLHAGINAVTGDFSLSCRGFLIEAGQLTTAINQITASGNYFELLKLIDGVANDFVFEDIDSVSVYGAPSISAEKLVISGK
jgi:PmbA protein